MDQEPSSAASPLHLPPVPLRSRVPHLWLVACAASLALVAVVAITIDRSHDEGPIIHHYGFPLFFMKTGCCYAHVHWPSLLIDWIAYLVPTSLVLTLLYGGMSWRMLPRFERGFVCVIHAIAVIVLIHVSSARASDHAFRSYGGDEVKYSLTVFLM